MIGAPTRRILIRRQIFDYAEKAPFVPSGHSVLGAIEIDQSERLMCHECGRFFLGLNKHVSQEHGDVRSYKLKHRINLGTPLLSPAVIRNGNYSRHPPPRSSGIASSAKRGPRAEMANEKLQCREQLLARMKKIAAELGPDPRIGTAEFRDVTGIGIGIVRREFGSLRAAMEESGLFALRRGRFDKRILVELIRDFYVSNGRLPRQKDFSPPALPGKGVVSYHFGSWENAMQAAGLGLVYARQRSEQLSHARAVRRQPS